MSAPEPSRATPVDIVLPPHGIAAFSSRHDRGFAMAMKHDPFFELVYIRRGAGHCRTDGDDIPLSAHQLLLIPPGQPHRFHDKLDQPLMVYGVCFAPDRLRRYPDEEDLFQDVSHRLPPNQTLPVHNGYTQQEISDTVRDILFEQTEHGRGYVTRIRCLLFTLFLTILRADPAATNDRAPDPIAVSLDYIRHHFHKPLTVAELADGCALSTRRYTDRFKRATGTTCIRYINTLRIDHVKKRLDAGADIRMAMIDSGFADVSHFYKLFKAATGLTPKQYTDAARQKPGRAGV